VCTDAYGVYSQYNLGKYHCPSKAETSLVESKNSLIRHYLARFHRKTKRYSKALDMIFHSLILLFNKKLLLTMII
jgi:insertion element IS1 protein InsB